ncbi:MAG: hypothetical protein ThorAB25_07090 [Candidatus Thorarchaeota archaeon AB_25]|nr:MAG: hypothetical protein ThorAB25_07090 [Candidatus Thorarchaeota archaeon AB_25]
MKKRVSVLFLSFLLVVSLIQCYATAETPRSNDILREAKFDDLSLRALTAQQYSNSWGGSADDEVTAFWFEGPDIVYLAGTTTSTDFPDVNGYQTTYAGGTDGFIMKLNIATDTVIYSTYIGGEDLDKITDIVVDDEGNLFATGFTKSADLPVASAYQDNYVNQEDIFLLKLDPTGDDLIYSTYFGGDGPDKSYSIDIDSDGNVYIFGNGYGTNIPLVNPIDDERYLEEGYFLKFNSTGNGLNFSSYIGGSDRDYAKSISLDDDNNVYLIGSTSSTDFPHLNGYDTSYNGAQDCFVVKVNSALDEIIYSTYIGGQAADEPNQVFVDDSGQVYLTGYTISSDFPTINAYDEVFGGGMDCFVCILSADGSSLDYSTYIGGSAVDIGQALAYSNEAVYITGYSKSNDFPTTSGADSSLSGEIDCFVFKLNLSTDTLDYSIYLGGSGDDYGQGIVLDADQNILVVGNTDSEDFPTDESHNGANDLFLHEIPKPVPTEDFELPPWILYVGVGVAGVVVIAVVVYFRRR